MDDAFIATDWTFKEPTFRQFPHHPHRTIWIGVIRTFWRATHDFHIGLLHAQVTGFRLRQLLTQPLVFINHRNGRMSA